METLKLETMLSDQTVLNQCDKIARNLARDIDTAKDISQTALLELWENRARYDLEFQKSEKDYETAFYGRFWIIAKQANRKINRDKNNRVDYSEDYDQPAEVEDNTLTDHIYESLPEHLHDLLTDMLNDTAITVIAKKLRSDPRTLYRKMEQIKTILAPIMLEITGEVDFMKMSEIVKQASGNLKTNTDMILIDQRSDRLNALQLEAIKRILETEARKHDCRITQGYDSLMIEHGDGSITQAEKPNKFYITSINNPHLPGVNAGAPCLDMRRGRSIKGRDDIWVEQNQNTEDTRAQSTEHSKRRQSTPEPIPALA